MLHPVLSLKRSSTSPVKMVAKSVAVSAGSHRNMAVLRKRFIFSTSSESCRFRIARVVRRHVQCCCRSNGCPRSNEEISINQSSASIFNISRLKEETKWKKAARSSLIKPCIPGVAEHNNFVLKRHTYVIYVIRHTIVKAIRGKKRVLAEVFQNVKAFPRKRLLKFKMPYLPQK